MSNNEMTPAWVVKNFLPDYEKKRRIEYVLNVMEDLPHEEVERRFVEYYFPKALYKLLEAQREVCAEVGQNLFDIECSTIQNCKYCDGRCGSIDHAKYEIANVSIPKPKNK